MSNQSFRPDDLLPLWAKLSRGNTQPKNYHPLLCHLIDVGAVTRAMWESVVSPWTRRRVADTLALNESDAGRWFAFFGAAHDIGKACPLFQIRKETPTQLREGIHALGLPIPSPSALGPINHGAVSAKTLNDDLSKEFGIPRGVAAQVAISIGGHHGVFPGYGATRCFGDIHLGGPRWSQARLTLLHELISVLGVPVSTIPQRIDTGTAMWLAGLVSVADWIGSDERYFRHAISDVTQPVPVDSMTYRQCAESAAQRGLEQLHWAERSRLRPNRTFHDLFGIATAAPVQRDIIQTVDRTDGQALVIVEAPMGEGKSEAAMYLAYRWSATLGQHGCYFALPSQATSNQMFGRVEAFLEKCYDGKAITLQLLHGHASLSAAFQALLDDGNRMLTPQGIYDDAAYPSNNPDVVAGEWFTYRKRGLLAPFGVGTVDQALLAVLKARHVFVRLFGLAGKTVIVDEVHAYDTYMTKLLEQLLRWLGTLGCSVVLLSATLPASRREKLVSAFRDGRCTAPERGVQGTAADTERAGHRPAAPYPRVTWVPASAGSPVTVRHVAASDRSRKTVHLERIDGRVPDLPDAPFVLGERLREAITDGGCAAVICNTVRRAQEVYRALKRYFPGEADDGLPELDLLHARYPFEERDRREQRALVRFGKPDGMVETEAGTQAVRRPRRAILVATQIIEQSLDLDFDLMVTDLAPADLILQRTGRLWRHKRGRGDGSMGRPSGMHAPTLWLCVPELADDGIPAFARRKRSIVYDNHVLLRSWYELRHRSELRVPDDVEALIEAVYGDDSACPGDLDAAWQGVWAATWDAQQEAINSEEDQAHNRYIKQPGLKKGKASLDEITGEPRQEDAPDLHPALQAVTRLTEPTVSIVLLYRLADQVYLDVAGGTPIDLDKQPDVPATERLLKRSLTVSGFGIVRELTKEEAIAAAPLARGWQKSALLRHYRPLILDATGRAQVGAYSVRLDADEGLLIARTAQDAEEVL